MVLIDPNRSKAGGARQREFEIEHLTVEHARVRCRRGESPPPFWYAVTLELLEGDRWRTVRLWDNADGLDEHHEHAYTRGGEKRRPRILEFASTNQAMAAAIAEAKRRVKTIVREWEAL